MSFFYNGRLPWYAWGGSKNQQSIGGFLYQANGDLVHLNVPLEGAGRPSWEPKQNETGSIANTAPFEGSPCDAQLPWKTIDIGSSAREAMLTQNGELYTFYNDTTLPFWSSTPSYVLRGQITRWKSPLVQKPIRFLAYNTPARRRVFNGQSQLHDIGLLIDTDGNAWWAQRLIRTYFPANQRVPVFDQAQSVSLPAGKKAKFVHWGANSRYGATPGVNPSFAEQYMAVLTTEDNETYIRRDDEAEWTKLTGGCVIPTISYPANANVGEWNTNALPTLTVPPPGGAGTPATIAYWFNPISGTRSRLGGVVITNPGSGYTSDVNVTFSAPPVQHTQPIVTLQVFNDHVVSAHINLYPSSFNLLDDVIFLTASGKTCSLIRYVFHGSQFALNDAQFVKYFQLLDRTWTNPKNAIGFSARNQYFPSDRNPGQGFIPCDTFIGADKKLYKYNTQAVVPTAAPGYEVIDNGPWASLAFSGNTFCGVKEDGTMYTWGQNSLPSFGGDSFGGVFFGDGSAVGATRTATRIAPECDWLQVFGIGAQGFIAIRKDAICRELDQPMEYFPDWHYQTQT